MGACETLIPLPGHRSPDTSNGTLYRDVCARPSYEQVMGKFISAKTAKSELAQANAAPIVADDPDAVASLSTTIAPVEAQISIQTIAAGPRHSETLNERRD